jgi:hypothetical protein
VSCTGLPVSYSDLQRIIWSRSSELNWYRNIRTCALGESVNAIVRASLGTRRCLTKSEAASIYSLQMRTPAAMVRDVHARALAIESLIQGVTLEHPLVS